MFYLVFVPRQDCNCKGFVFLFYFYYTQTILINHSIYLFYLPNFPYTNTASPFIVEIISRLYIKTLQVYIKISCNLIRTRTHIVLYTERNSVQAVASFPSYARTATSHTYEFGWPLMLARHR